MGGVGVGRQVEWSLVVVVQFGQCGWEVGRGIVKRGRLYDLGGMVGVREGRQLHWELRACIPVV